MSATLKLSPLLESLSNPVSEAIAPQSLGSAMREELDQLTQTLDKQLFFIASCSKSGSTWLQHVLDGHPAIACYGEAFLITVLRNLFGQLQQTYNRSHKCGHKRNNDPRRGDLSNQNIQTLHRLASSMIMSRWITDPNVKAVGDKTPENAITSTQLDKDFPGCKIIHLIRDGRDVCVSGYFHNLREKGEGFKRQFPTLASYIPLMAEKKWKPYIIACRKFGDAHPDRFTEVRYEELHGIFDEAVGRLLEFIGVSATADELEKCRDSGSFKRLSGGRQRGEEDKSNFYRKGEVGDWRNHFDDECVEVFKRCAGDLAVELGYE